MTIKTVPSQLLTYLPALYQEESSFLAQFLLPFEKILLGRADDVAFYMARQGASDNPAAPVPQRGLEEVIADLATFFDPYKTPSEFLPWLAGWTAFLLRADLHEDQQRNFLAEIIALYRWRGTKANLQRLLEIFTVGTPEVGETAAVEFQIGTYSTIGKDTCLGGGRPHFFEVKISMPETTPNVQRQRAIACALIELEKPAHTDYRLEVIFPSMQIGKHSTVGIDTLLGAVPPSKNA